MMTINATTTQQRPTTSLPPDAQSMAGGVPFDVKSAGGDAVAFKMKTSRGPVDMVWDKKSDTLLVGGKPASEDMKNAVVARLAQAALAAIRKGSPYDQMRTDMMTSEPRTTPLPAKKEPPLPSTP